MQLPELLTGHERSRVPADVEDRGLSAPWFAAVLALLVFAAFPQVLLGLQTFVIRDFAFFSYPVAHYQRECFWRGELPLWNPYSHCGLPFLAQWNTMPLYPPALVYLLFPLSWSLSFFCLVHLFWAGLGMYFLAYRWTGNREAACVAGMIFGFNGFALNLLMWPSHIATLSWMPWVVLCVERGWNEGGRRLLVAVLVGALQMLAGGPETILFTWLILLGLWIAQLLGWLPAPPGSYSLDTPDAPRPQRLVLLWRFPLMTALVAGLAAAQLLPFLDLAAHSQREQGFADARWSMPSWGWANLLVPMVFGTTMKQNIFYQYGQYWTSSYYLGVGAVLFALVAVTRVRNRRVWFLALAGALGLVLATGDQTVLSRWARQVFPQLTLMTYPVKFVGVTIFVTPLLAAFGMSHLARAGEERPTMARRVVLFTGSVLLATIAFILLWAWRFPLPGNKFPVTLSNGLSRAVILIVLVILLIRWQSPGMLTIGKPIAPNTPFLILLLRAIWSVLFQPRSIVLLLLFLWLDVKTHEPQQNPAVPTWVYTPGLAAQKLAMNPQPALGASRAMLAPEAVAKFRELLLEDPKDNLLVKRVGYFADCNLLDDVPKVDGFFSLCPRECGELNSVLYVSRQAYSSRLPDFMSVSQSTAPPEHSNWERRDAFMPLATAGQKPVFLDDTNAVRTLIGPDFDGREIVLLPLEAKSIVTVTNQTRAQVRSRLWTAHRIDLEVEATEPSLVVISQTYYHRWRVHINGRETPLLRANYAFQAFEAPAGLNQVRLVYRDTAFEAGVGISGGVLLGCLAVAVLPRRRKTHA